MHLAVNLRIVFCMCGWAALFLSGALLAPIAISLIKGDGEALIFLKSAAVAAAVAGLLIWQGHNKMKTYEVQSRDGLATVGLAWLLIGVLGALPYWISDALPGFWDGLFESFSGLSTTGATVLNNIESLPPSLLFWRAATHWLGGMGIIVLMLAVLPFFGLSGVQLFKNESSLGQTRLKPRIAQTSKALWLIYVGLTVLLIALLLAGGMSWFDSICHAFSAISTGGYSSRNLSIAHFKSGYFEVILTIFMFLGSLNFSLYYLAVKGDFKSFYTNTECRVFTLIIIMASLMVFTSLLTSGFYPSVLTALRHSFFQVVSVISTTGLTSYNWEEWPHFSQGVLFILFFIGGCAGSTGGGLKCIRWILVFKGIHRTLRQHVHPRAVLPVRLGNRAVPESVMTAVWSFVAIYIIMITVATLSLAAMDVDLMTAFSASVSALGNVGLGLGKVSTSSNFGHLPGLGKGLLSLMMFIGRLEFFTILILFMPEFWQKK